MVTDEEEKELRKAYNIVRDVMVRRAVLLGPTVLSRKHGVSKAALLSAFSYWEVVFTLLFILEHSRSPAAFMRMVEHMCKKMETEALRMLNVHDEDINSDELRVYTREMYQRIFDSCLRE